MRLLWILLGLAVLIIIPFMIWGGSLEESFSFENASEWLRGFGAWGGIVGIGLLLVDVVLPIPSTIVMSALGFVYGPVWGGLLAAAGSFTAGLVAYGICRSLGQRPAQWIAGEKDLARGQVLFSRYGGWFVAWSRWLPVLQEAIACMAGLVRMPFRKFVVALACGCIPVGFAFAAIGYTGVQYPWVAVALSIAVPPILWLIATRLFRQQSA